jgi:hypothetical protein
LTAVLSTAGVHKTHRIARCRWLMPVTLVTWKAEIGKTMVPDQSISTEKKMFVVVCTCHSNYGRKPGQKSETLSQK